MGALTRRHHRAIVRGARDGRCRKAALSSPAPGSQHLQTSDMVTDNGPLPIQRTTGRTHTLRSVDAPASSSMLCVRKLAGEIGVQPADLLRSLLAHDIDVLSVSDRVHRITPAEWERWNALRRQSLVTRFQQKERKAAFVGKGEAAPKRRATFTR